MTITIPTCNSTTEIKGSESMGQSLFTVNTNFNNLDRGICELGKEIIRLDNFIKSLSAKDSPTIDMSFSVAGYFLSSDVKNNSIGTIKLGVDIPQTTKTFLKLPQLSNLIDAQISSPQTEQVLAWNGTQWTNSPLVDEIGARSLPELTDVRVANLQDTQVLVYRSSDSKWINGPDQGLSAIPDGDYDDINVSGNGLIWNIRPGRVNSLELATAAVSTAQIRDLEIINEKFDNNTIRIEKINFDVGEINTGVNVGEESNFFKEKVGSVLQLRKLLPAGTASFRTQRNTVFIEVPIPNDAPPYRGQNVGTGESIFKAVQDNYIYQFKTIKAGDTGGIVVTSTDNEVVISRPVRALGLSLIGYNQDGQILTATQIGAKIAEVYPPENFNTGTICNVQIEYPEIASTVTTEVSIPFTLKYKHKVETTETCHAVTGTRCESSTKVTLEWIDPVVTRVQEPNNKGVLKNTNYWAGSKDLEATLSAGGTTNLRLLPSATERPTFRTYRREGSTWSLVA